MQFLFPAFLWASLAIAIPIIIHLFYFRRYKKVYFSNVQFLKEVKEETSARSRLRNLLVLLMRCLAIIFLVLAFAQPFIPLSKDVSQGPRAVSIYIDNSFSMSALSEELPLLQLAKKRALEVIEAYSAEDRFQILTNDFEGRHQRLVGQDDARTLVEEIAISPAVRNLSQVSDRQKQVLELSGMENQVSYWLTDFQQNSSDLAAVSDTLTQINLIPLDAVQERNISIDSAWLEAPVPLFNQNNRILVQIRNWTDQEAENVRLSHQYAGEEKPEGLLNIPPNSAVIDTVNITPRQTGWHQVQLQITDYPVQFDDQLYLCFQVPEVMAVLSINEAAPNSFLNAAVSGIPNFRIDQADSRGLDYSKFAGYQLIVLNGLTAYSSGLAFELKQYADNGGNVLVFPAPNADLSSLDAFLKGFQSPGVQNFNQTPRQVSQVNFEEFVFQDVFENRSANLKLPSTIGNFIWRRTGASTAENLLTYRDGNPFLSKFRTGQGHLYLCAAPLEETYSNLVRHAEVFVPMLYKTAISAGTRVQVAYTLGVDEVVSAPVTTSTADLAYRLKGAGGEFIPEQRINNSRVFLGLQREIAQAGFYDLTDAQDRQVYQFAFNYDRRESDLRYLKNADLQGALRPNMTLLDANVQANFSAVVGEQNTGIVLWRWCLILALLFLAAEVLLLRTTGRK